MQLLETADDCFDGNEILDDTLVKELATALFQSDQYRIFFEKGHSKQAVKEVEEKLSQKLADTYRSLLVRSKDPLVQRLNTLLQS